MGFEVFDWARALSNVAGSQVGRTRCSPKGIEWESVMWLCGVPLRPIFCGLFQITLWISAIINYSAQQETLLASLGNFLARENERHSYFMGKRVQSSLGGVLTFLWWIPWFASVISNYYTVYKCYCWVNDITIGDYYSIIIINSRNFNICYSSVCILDFINFVFWWIWLNYLIKLVIVN